MRDDEVIILESSHQFLHELQALKGACLCEVIMCRVACPVTRGQPRLKQPLRWWRHHLHLHIHFVMTCLLDGPASKSCQVSVPFKDLLSTGCVHGYMIFKYLVSRLAYVLK